METMTAPLEDGRARNKRATRHALREATLELGVAAGLSEVTVEQIAARAGVSTRTFFNYFDSKEDAAALDVFVVDADQLADLARGDRTSTWAALSELFVADIARAHRESPDLLRFMSLQASDRQLQAHQLGRFTVFLRELADAVARRLGGRVSDRLTAELMAGSCITAARVGLETWAARGGRGQPGTHVARAFAVLAPAFSEERS